MSAVGMTRQERANDLARRVSALEQEERELIERIAAHKEWRAQHGHQDQEERFILAELEAVVPALSTLYYQVAGRTYPEHRPDLTNKAKEVARYLDIVAAELRLFARGGQIEGRALDLG